MKNFLLVTTARLAIVAAPLAASMLIIAGVHPARAADQSPVPHLPTKTPIVPPAISNWTGCYIGIQGGGGAVSDTFISTSFDGNNNFLHGGGGFAGGQIGCNYQNGAMVFGLEGEAWSGLTNPQYFILPSATENRFTRNPWITDVAVRAGLAFDHALFYGKAGIAEGRFAFSETRFGVVPQGQGASTLTGVLLGVGLEYGFAPNWSARLEYDHIEYADRLVHFDSIIGIPFNVTESASADLIKAGISYRFGAPSLPLASDGPPTHTGIFKAPVSKAPAPGAFSWTGCYAGVHGGGGWMRDTFVGGDINGGGGFAGGQLGCNIQTGAIVWGVEGEAAWSGLTDHFHLDGGFVSDDATRNRWSADAAARAGVAVDRTLIYGKAGLAAGRFEFSFAQSNPTEGQNGSATLAGLLVGGGIEYAVAPNWSIKLEYDHIDYFGRDVGFDTPFVGHIVEHDAAATDVLKLGVNYRFANGPFGDVPFAPTVDRAASGPAILKAPIYKATAAATGTWTGCYAGVHGGGGILADPFVLGGSDSNPISTSSGGFAGGQLGCDVQTGALVWGLEGEAAWSRIINRVDNSGALIQSFDSSSDLVWTADIATRAGVGIDRGLFYGKAGAAAGRLDFSFTRSDGVFENGASTLAGLLLGAGIEYALAPNWSVLLEYDRIAYAGRVVHFATSGITPLSENLSATVNEAKAGLNYRFGGAPASPASGRSRNAQNLLPPPAIDWTGCYAGIHAGGGIIDDTLVPPFVGATPRGAGAVAGGQAGCNLQTGIMVFGLEGDAAWSGLVNRTSFSRTGGTTEQSSDRNRWTADLAARTGIAFDRALLYGKAGVAAGRFDFFAVDNLGDFLQGGATLTGLLLGLGVEYAFAPNWSAKLEYDHVGYLSRNVDLGVNASTNESVTTNTVKAGINYKFFGPSGVVVARD